MEGSEFIGSSDRHEAFGFVLAGGESSRMGSDKALVQLGGRYLIQHAIEILRRAGIEVAIAGTRADLGAYAPVIVDARAGKGPLSGLCSALQSTNARRSVFLPVDMPFIPSVLISYMLAKSAEFDAAVTIVEAAGIAQTFPAVIDRTIFPALLAALERGDSGCLRGFHSATHTVAQSIVQLPLASILQSQMCHPKGVPAERWFLNVNSLDDLRVAEDLLRNSESQSHW